MSGTAYKDEMVIKTLKDKIHEGTKKALKATNFAIELFGDSCDEVGYETLPEFSEPAEMEETKMSGKACYLPKLKTSHLLADTQMLDSILEKFKEGNMSFIGSAGSGKTTVMKTIALNTINRKYAGLFNVNIVIFVKCDEVITQTKSSHLLSSCDQYSHLSPDELKQFDVFCRENPDKVLFVLDGIDNFPKYFIDRATNLKKKDRVSYLVHQLMANELYPGCKIISSSRSYTELGQKNQKSNSVVLIRGFSEEAIESIIQKSMPVKANETILFFRQNPLVSELCRTPMFLMFTLLAKKEDETFSPTVKTEILLFLFHSLLRSEHSKPNFTERTWLKLGKVCFGMLKKGEYYFTRDDLRHNDLRSEEIDDLLQSRLVEGRDRFYFAHQSISDMLASLYMLKKVRKEKFETEVLKNLEQPQFEMVEYMLSGMLLNESTKKWNTFQHDEDLEEKKELLRSHFRQRLRTSMTDCDFFWMKRLILSLYEAGDGAKDLISEEMKSIVFDLPFQFLFLSTSDYRAIGSVAAEATKLEELAITGFWSIDRDLETMFDPLIKRKPKIVKLDLSYGFLNPESMGVIGDVARLCKVEHLLIASNFLYQQQPERRMKLLKRGLKEHRLKSLDISYNEDKLTNQEMLSERESKPLKLVYKLDEKQKKSLLSQFFADKIVVEIPSPGRCKHASYGFIHSVTTLFSNVENNVYLYCWMIPEREQLLIQKQLDSSSNLRLCVNLCSDVTLRHRAILAVTEFKKHAPRQTMQKDITNLAAKLLACKIPIGPEVPTTPQQEKGGFSAHMGKTSLSSDERKSDSERSSSPSKVESKKDSQQSLSMSRRKPSESLYTTVSVKPEHLTDLKLSETIEQLTRYEEISELEFWECTKVKDGIGKVLSRMKGKVMNLSIKATKNIDKLAKAVHGFISTCETESLNLEECDCVEEFLTELRDLLHKSKLPTLRKLNISYIGGISDYSVVRDISFGQLEELRMMNCYLDSEKIEQLCSGVTEPKIKVLDISYNADLDKNDIAMLGKLLANETDAISLRGCELTDEILQGFLEPSFHGKRVTSLDLSYNEKMDADDINAVGEAVKTLRVDELSLRYCNIVEEDLRLMTSVLDGHKLSHLELKGNAKIGLVLPALFNMLKGEDTRLGIGDCKLNCMQLQTLARHMRDTKKRLSYLDISDSERRMSDSVIGVICKVMQYIDKEFIVCCPNVENFKSHFQNALSELPDKGPKVVYSRGAVKEDQRSFVVCRKTHLVI